MFPFLKKNLFIFTALTLLLGALILISLNIKGKTEFSFREKFILTLTTPFQKGIIFLEKKMITLWKNYLFLVNLKEENLYLKKLVTQLKEENNLLREEVMAAGRYKELLAFKEKFPYSLLPAQIIGEDASSWFKTILIDKGSKEGLKRGMAVITPQGVVGKILKVAPNFSQVLLIIDPNSSVDVLIQRTRFKGIVEGRGKALCELKYIPRLEEIKEGDILLTSGLGGSFPKGLMVGRVSKVEKKKTGLFQYIEVNPEVDFSRLEEVLVVSSPS